VIILYSGYLAGFFPKEENISWESHLFGAIAGAWTAFIFRSYRESDEEPIQYEWKGKNHEPSDYYFPRDVFEKTLEQRKQESEDILNSDSQIKID
jgi:hypothetical protein